MLPMMLAKKILDLSEEELTKVLRQLEMEDRELYNTLKEKIEDI
jgi:succinate dehydrogenase flavin-adding protein (antitoxin of CptAB toxin-antitoxin module)